MSHQQITLSFDIQHLAANSIGLHSESSWIDWAKNKQWPENKDITATAIPAMARRRMSTLCKLAVQNALELLEKNDVDYMVFASRHGELHRSVKLIEDILQGNDASPMAFSQSVHNTASGLTTIVSKKPIPTTSISASDNTFQSALIDTWIYLENNPNSKVLLIDFDEPLPEIYAQFETQKYQSYSLGMILQQGSTYTCVSNPNKTDNLQSMPQGLNFLENYLLKKQQWEISSKNQTWTWNRNESSE